MEHSPSVDLVPSSPFCWIAKPNGLGVPPMAIPTRDVNSQNCQPVGPLEPSLPDKRCLTQCLTQFVFTLDLILCWVFWNGLEDTHMFAPRSRLQGHLCHTCTKMLTHPPARCPSASFWAPKTSLFSYSEHLPCTKPFRWPLQEPPLQWMAGGPVSHWFWGSHAFICIGTALSMNQLTSSHPPNHEPDLELVKTC